MTDWPPTSPTDHPASAAAGLFVFRSNRVEHLAAALGADLRSAPLPDPMSPELIVIGNRGMERWLSHQLAEQLGICANVQFWFPQRVLDAELREAQPAEHRALSPAAWQPQALAWSILHELPGLLAEGDPALLGPLRGALGESSILHDVPVVDRRAWSLAAELAQVFDRLVAYRPNEALAWTRGAGADEALIPWQPLLWSRLIARVGAEHGASQLERALPRWRSGAAKPTVPRVSIFGVSLLPPAWLEQLMGLAHHIPVNLYLLAPSRAWWADLAGRIDRSALDLRTLERDEALPRALGLDEAHDQLHPLLRSLGRVPRDLQVLLAELEEAQGEAAVVQDVGDLLFNDPLRSTPRPGLLHHLQHDLLEAHHPAALRAARPAWSADDRSVQVHAAHGLLRQVEVLHDALITAFADDPTLEPRDVIVLCPDIEAAAPLIQAVFGGAGREGGSAIPFRIADLSVRRLNPVADVLLRALELSQGRATASAVLDLLELEPVQRRFGLDGQSLRQLEDWIDQSGVRCAIDEAHRAGFEGQPAERANSWRFGLERLALGALGPDEGALLLGVAPIDGVQGAGAGLAGRLIDACSTLFSAMIALTEARGLPDWCALLLGLIDELTEMDPEGAWLSRRVREAIEGLAEEGRLAQASLQVRPEAMLALLRGRFEVAAEALGMQSGAVTFCAMKPMRSVPYAVVAMLGLDEGAFPRQGSKRGFDPTELRPRPGDSNPRDEDRYLFLEALLAARARLLILYSGRDERSNQERPPAVPVSELLDALELTQASPDGRPLRAHLLFHHSLQAFHPDNFRPLWPPAPGEAQPRPWSHSEGLRRAAVAASAPPAPLAPPPAPAPLPAVTEVNIDDLVAFFQSPARALLRRRLGIFLSRGAEAVADREPIELDALERWSLADTLLDARLRAGPGADPAAVVRAVQARARAVGGLPFGQSGEQAFLREHGLVEAILELIAPLTTGSPTAVHRSITLRVSAHPFGAAASAAAPTELRLVGRSPTVFSPPGFDAPVTVLALIGQEDPKRLLRVWLPHLLRLATEAEGSPRAVLAHGSVVKGVPKAELKGFGAPSAEDPRGWAQAQLEALLRLYLLGQTAPLPLPTLAGYAFAKATHGKLELGALLAPDTLPPEAEQLRQQALAAALAAFGSPGGGGFGATDHDDPYLRRAWQQGHPVLGAADGAAGGAPTPAFVEAALTLWHPLLSARCTTQKIVRKGEVTPW